jgi:hypothetical protein
VSAVGESNVGRHRIIGLSALCVGALVLAGCAPGAASTRSATPRPTDTDAALLSEAIDVYTRYSAALDVVLASGEDDYAALEEVTTEAFLDTLRADDEFSRGEWRTSGSTSFDSETLVKADDTSLTLQLCRDVSRVAILDTSGNDITPPDRADRFAVTVAFIRSKEGSLEIDSSDRNVEDASCER